MRTRTVRALVPTLDHLERLADSRGLFEHARGTVRRVAHGYCTDDNARLVQVTLREPRSVASDKLLSLSLRFILDAQASDGRTHNRMNHGGRWTDRPNHEDCWGRSLAALGAAAASHPDPSFRGRALSGFETGAQQRSTDVRAMAFAALGAADLLGRYPSHDAARSLVVDAAAMLPSEPRSDWQWPEARLRYANATVAEAVFAAGSALGDDMLTGRGLDMLLWLLTRDAASGHLSVVGTAGAGPTDRGPQYDQQPIEVGGLADACARALALTGDEQWRRGIELAVGWFMGSNDGGVPMYDASSGGGFDGLHRVGVNQNQGAESTLAFVSTMQQALAIGIAA